MYTSGQREQTVNLPAQPSKVRILPHPPNTAVIAQLVEHRIENPSVTGSIPVRSTNLRKQTPCKSCERTCGQIMEISAARRCGVLPVCNAVKIQDIGWIPKSSL